MEEPKPSILAQMILTLISIFQAVVFNAWPLCLDLKAEAKDLCRSDLVFSQ